jgi:uncharacterized membrane protein
MIYVHVRTHLDPSYESFCKIGERLDCETAATSRFSSLAGVPLAFWGLAGACAMAVLAGTRALLPLCAGAAAVSAGLALVSAFSLRVLCLLCAASWIVDWTLFALALRWRGHAVAATTARLAVAGGLFAFVAAAGWLATPRVAVLSAWRDGLRVSHGVDALGHPWLGAADAPLVIEEFVDYGCPHCRDAHARIRAEVERNAGSVRLVRHDYPRTKCLPVPRHPDRSSLCFHARVAHCALLASRFWETSDWLFSRREAWKRPDVAQAARVAGTAEDELRACMNRKETFEATHEEFLHGQAAGVRGTPAFVVGGQRKKLAEVLDAIRAAP